MKFKNEVIVGIFVLLAIIVVVIGAFWLSGNPFGQQQRELAAVFQQVGLIREGNPVVFRGVQIGRVTGVQLAPQANGVLVEMLVDPEIRVAPDAVVVLSPQSFFGDWQAEITARGAYPTLQFTRAPIPGVLPGAALPDITQLTAVASRIAGSVEVLSDRFEIAFTDETAIRLRQSIENVAEISAQLGGFVEAQTQTLDNISGEVLAATQNISATTTTIQQTFEEGEVQQILANARQASENLQQLTVELQQSTQGIPGLVARVDTTLVSVDRLAQNLNTTVEAVQPQIAELGPTLAETRQAMATLNRLTAQIEQGEGTLGRLVADPALYEETQRAIATLSRLMAALQANPQNYLRGVVDVF